MAPDVCFASANPDLLVGFVEARGVTPGAAPRALAEALDALVARRRDEDFPPPDLRAAIRDLLRRGGFRPAGRSKPASEYLARAAVEGTFPRIGNLVDLANLYSLETGYPLSILDLDRALATTGALEVREGRPGERYVSNASGQEIDVAGLLGIARAGGGMLANPVKDSLETKTRDDTQNVLGAVYATRRLLGPLGARALAEGLGRLLSLHAGAGTVRTYVLGAEAEGSAP